mmetsp:Transcript_11497/g.11455  ORF Transcript_11497/g.11455 Transcript_11497/m.11455 type:complete len:121 (-) Transcript_11497:610-972(-)
MKAKETAFYMKIHREGNSNSLTLKTTSSKDFAHLGKSDLENISERSSVLSLRYPQTLGVKQTPRIQNFCESNDDLANYGKEERKSEESDEDSLHLETENSIDNNFSPSSQMYDVNKFEEN